jgi:hypothetical protein
MNYSLILDVWIIVSAVLSTSISAVAIWMAYNTRKTIRKRRE